MTFTGTVLLVDDEAHVRKFLGVILQQIGTPRVLEASNGQEGIAIYQRENPDLVLLDINMPIMDGIQTLRVLLETDPECMVVMLTSVRDRNQIEKAAGMGAISYIPKDVPKEEILQALKETIANCFEDNSD